MCIQVKLCLLWHKKLLQYWQCEVQEEEVAMMEWKSGGPDKHYQELKY
jgi:hypothetical protein